MRIALAILVTSATSLAQSTTRVSVDPNGMQVCGASDISPTAISADGRFVALYGFAELIPGAGGQQVCVRDRQAGTIELASASTAGVPGNNSSRWPSVSADGRFVAFVSNASNLVAGDTNGCADVFVRDRQLGTTERVSVGASGAQANGYCTWTSISADGRWVAFSSEATNLVPSDTNGCSDVFVRDLQLGTTERVSLGGGGVQANGDCIDPAISSDGRFVAFWGSASNLVPLDTNGKKDVFVRDRLNGTTDRVSLGANGAQANGDSGYPADDVAISSDGRFVAFASVATNLVTGDVNGSCDVFVRDRQLGTTECVSVDSSGAPGNDESGDYSVSMSADGRFVAFNSFATNLVAGDTNNDWDIFVRDRQLGTTSRKNTSSGGGQANGTSLRAGISADGTCVVFESDATNLVPGDTNGVADVFVREGADADCNNNGVGDAQDILSGTSNDCDGNGIPDECDLAQGSVVDCDANGLLDACELAANPSLDQNHDGRIDACALDCQPFWQSYVGGPLGVDAGIGAMCVHDDGTGPALYVGGSFHNAGGVPAVGIAKWDGAAWSALGAGVGGGVADYVVALATYDSGSGPALYAGGHFASAGGAPASGLARWDGQAWSAIGAGTINGVSAFAVCDLGTGPQLYISSGHSLYSYDGTSVTLVPLGPGLGFFTVRALAAFDDGSGLALYLGGQDPNYERALTVRWNGATATQFPGDNYFTVVRLAVHDDGSSAALYAATAHSFNLAAGGVARWNGSGWTAAVGLNGNIGALGSIDDGSGPALLACGTFYGPCGTVNGAARWNGTNWASLPIRADNPLVCACPFDDGTTPALYVGGDFTVVNQAPANHIGSWGLPAGCAQMGIVICEPGQNGVLACPCSNPPAAAGRGCNNSSGTGGAQLTTTGFARLGADTLVFATNGEKRGASSLLLQCSQVHATGLVFGQGVRCVAGSTKRLYLKTAIAGSITAPAAGDLSVSARSAALGAPLAPGMHQYYGVYYRDPILLGGCPATSAFNVTQQLDVLWAP